MRHSTISHPLAHHAGVYSITNLDTGHVYIGSTARSFRTRWVRHQNDLRNGVHACPDLQRAWGGTPPERFAFDVLEVAGCDGLREREQAFMDGCQSCGTVLYNDHRAYKEPIDEYTEDELFDALYDLLPEPL